MAHAVSFRLAAPWSRLFHVPRWGCCDVLWLLLVMVSFAAIGSCTPGRRCVGRPDPARDAQFTDSPPASFGWRPFHLQPRAVDRQRVLEPDTALAL